MVVDFHTHLFPDALAPRAIGKLAATAGIPTTTDGTLAGTLRRMDEAGVDMAVVQHIATRPGQERKVNDFAAAIQGPRVRSFGSVHPDSPDALEELERIRSLGLAGIKLHPDYQGFFVDEDRMAPIYAAAQRLGLAVLFHAGYDPFSPTLVHAPADAIARVAAAYPELTVIAAHMGGLVDYDRAEAFLVGTRVYLDISMAAGRCPEAQFARMARHHGADRLLFATDTPWSGAEETLALLDTVHWTQAEREKILSGNALRILAGEK